MILNKYFNEKETENLAYEAYLEYARIMKNGDDLYDLSKLQVEAWVSATDRIIELVKCKDQSETDK